MVIAMVDFNVARMRYVGHDVPVHDPSVRRRFVHVRGWQHEG